MMFTPFRLPYGPNCGLIRVACALLTQDLIDWGSSMSWWKKLEFA